MIRPLNISPTLSGFFALFLWSTAATTASSLQSLPRYELLTLCFVISSIFTLLKVSIRNEWKTLKAPLAAWALVIVGVVLQQFLYIFAFNLASPAEVDLLIYLWPSVAVILSTLMFRERIRPQHILAVILGITAVFLLSCNRVSFQCFSLGHLYAILCAVTWAFYTVASRNQPAINSNIIGISYGLGLIISLLLHVRYEVFILPTYFECGCLLYYSLALTLGAYSLWTMGIQYGHSRSLTLSAYMKPVFSLFLLCIFGLATITTELLLAAVCIMFAGIIASVDLVLNLKKWEIRRKSTNNNSYLQRLPCAESTRKTVVS